MIAAAALIALAIGVALGLLGGGGGVLLVPALVYLLGVEVESAVATSLLVIGVTSAVAAVAHGRAGRVRYRVGLLFSATAMAGAFAGGRVAPLIPPAVLLTGFTLVMLATALAMMRPRRRGPSKAAPDPRKVLLIGALVGAVGGLVGAGGGFLIVPALILFGGLAAPEAIGTSLLAIALLALAGFAGHASHLRLDLRLVAAVTAAAVAGSLAGTRLGARVSPDGLRRGFAWFLLVVAVLLLAVQLVPRCSPKALG